MTSPQAHYYHSFSVSLCYSASATLPTGTARVAGATLTQLQSPGASTAIFQRTALLITLRRHYPTRRKTSQLRSHQAESQARTSPMTASLMATNLNYSPMKGRACLSTRMMTLIQASLTRVKRRTRLTRGFEIAAYGRYEIATTA